MSLLNKVVNKRMKNLNYWSAPAVMTAFLFISMMFIFSIEYIGLSNREKNVELRVTSLENSIILITNFFLKLVSIAHLQKLNAPVVDAANTDNTVHVEFGTFKSQVKEENIENMRKILLLGVQEQMGKPVNGSLTLV